MNQHTSETINMEQPLALNCIQTLEQAILTNQHQIEAWFRQQWLHTPAPFYSSVDLRNAGFKLAPVDTNLFPAGFNNLNPDYQTLCIQAVQNTLEKVYSGCLKILIIPESHSRNHFYFENLGRLYQILLQAGYDVRIGSIDPTLIQAKKIRLADGNELILEPLKRQANKVFIDGFQPCVILLNNDLSEGVPDILKNLKQAILPSLQLGWSNRRKSRHFWHYQQLAEEFAALIDIDPWLINPYFSHADQVDFSERSENIDLYSRVRQVFAEIDKKYQQYTIDKQPFVVVKADSGTYGMGILMINSPEELAQLNRKERNKMSTSKGGKKIEQVLIQEGVFSDERVGIEQAVAEPVIYMIGQHVVGGFYRVHKNRAANENLNAPGMHFEPLAFTCPCNTPDLTLKTDCQVNRFYTYGVIARLAALAAAREMAES